MIKKAIGFSLLILIGALVLNNMLGGFKPVETSVVILPPAYIYGQSFEGRYDSDVLTNLIEGMRTKLETGELEGELVILNYFDDRKEKRGDLKQFIGVITDQENLKNQNTGLTIQKIEFARAIEARVEIAKLVMPSPQKIKNEALSLAEEKNLELVEFSIERYAERELIIQFPIAL